jgi:hypothetical protein
MVLFGRGADYFIVAQKRRFKMRNLKAIDLVEFTGGGYSTSTCLLLGFGAGIALFSGPFGAIAAGAAIANLIINCC